MTGRYRYFNRALLLAGGTGISPMISIIEETCKNQNVSEVVLFFAN